MQRSGEKIENKTRLSSSRRALARRVFTPSKLITVFLLLFLAWILIAWALAEKLIVAKPLPRAEAILVLGGSSVYVERTQKAAEVYKRGVAPKVLLTDDGGYSGWSRREQRNTPFVELAQRELVAQGVPAESIEVVKPRGSGTIYEAELLEKIVKEKNLKSLLLVTSAYHSRRSLWTFERVLKNGVTEIGVETVPPGHQTPPPFVWWLSPLGWNVVAGEYVKFAYYWAYY